MNYEQPKTPNRGDRTPQRSLQHTPQHTPNRNRTPNRSTLTTPNRISTYSRPTFKSTARAPDFVAIAREQQRQESGGHNSFFAYNPEKEPIRVTLQTVFWKTN
jgi:hypothetical protein